jgi:hypothetical protein
MAVVMDMISKTFFYSTFTTHLMGQYGLSVEMSSVFFVINMVSYVIVLQFLNKITLKFGLKLTLAIGLLVSFTSVLLLPPIGIFPQ